MECLEFKRDFWTKKYKSPLSLLGPAEKNVISVWRGDQIATEAFCIESCFLKKGLGCNFGYRLFTCRLSVVGVSKTSGLGRKEDLADGRGLALQLVESLRGGRLGCFGLRPGFALRGSAIVRWRG